MRCPFCKKDNDKVVDTRPGDDGVAIRRRRECLECGRRYTTHERLEDSPLKVIKKDGRAEPFDLNKVIAGITRALRKRPVTPEEIADMGDQIEREIFESHDREVKVTEIADIIMRVLHKVDRVAYVRFVSVYREFEEVGEFIKEINKLEEEEDKQ